MLRPVVSLTAGAGLIIVLALEASPAAASIITVPTSLNPGDQYRLAFVTSTTRNATSTDISVYNKFVDDLAETVPELAALNLDWKAIASTSAIDARTNTSTDPTPAGDTGVPIFLLSDAKIADNYDDLWDSSLDNALYATESGVFPTGTFRVWTGTQTDGQASANPLGASSVTAGLDLNMNGGWISWWTRPSTHSYHLYAMSPTLTVPTNVVPEPSSVVIWAIGAVGLMGYRSIRKRKKTAASKRPIHTNH